MDLLSTDLAIFYKNYKNNVVYISVFLLIVCSILRSDTRYKSRIFHVNVFYAIMEDN